MKIIIKRYRNTNNNKNGACCWSKESSKITDFLRPGAECHIADTEGTFSKTVMLKRNKGE